MSHSKERAEKKCLNCKTELHGRYCHVCGQENIEPKQSVWHLITHFFNDITHFDSKFFDSTRLLVVRPGFLSKEYIAGRRASYLNPIRMYVFSSAIFFLAFYSMFRVDDLNVNIREPHREGRRATDSGSVQQIVTDQVAGKLAEKMKEGDSIQVHQAMEKLQTLGVPIPSDSATTGKSKRKKEENISLWSSDGDSPENFTRIADYDSAQLALPAAERDGWFKRMIRHREIEIRHKYGTDKKEFLRDLVEKFMHTFPYLLFVSLPLYAFFLKLLYWRRRKQFFFVDHGIFLIHLYIFTFLLLFAYFALWKLNDSWDSGWIRLLEGLLLGYGVYYAYRAMKNFYEQRTFKTILKFILLNLLAFISINILFSIFFVVAIFKV